MATMHKSERQKQEFGMRSEGWWVQPLLVGIIGIGLFLLLAPREKVRLPADKPGNTVAQQAPAATSSSGAQKTSLGFGDSHFALGRPLGSLPPEDHWPAARHTESTPQPLEPPQHVQELDALVAQFKNTKELTPEGAKEMKRLLREVRKQGADAVPAIRDFLRSQEDVDFDKLSGGELAEQHTLRQAMFDTLRQIGGDAAIAVSLEQLRTTQSPAEIAMLARNLEDAAPGMYRDEALRAANNALQQVLAVSKDPLEVRPLFETLRELGGVDAVSTLDQFPANADMVRYLRNKSATQTLPAVQTYALMALAGLPDGEGVAGLAALAADPNVPVEHRTAQPFQMLAQASADQVQAGKTLVELAQAGQIPDRAWSAVADALAGKQLQFPSQISGGALTAQNEADTSGVDAPFRRGFYDDNHNLLYEERIVSGDWSAKQVRQQLALIDNLLGATHSPAAAQALQQARATLQGKGH